jgi:hypothetical protein
MPTRAQYVAQRVGARMQERGDSMQLRRVSMLAGPVPYRNPPDYSADLVVTTGVRVGGQAYLGIRGSSVIGRLVPGDKVVCATTPTPTTWTVIAMPVSVGTDADGIPLASTGGVPFAGTPTPYRADSLAANNAWPVIPVTAPGTPDPALSIGVATSLIFAADVTVYGVPLSLTKMTAMGWTEVDTVGLSMAAYNAGPITPAPKVDDQIIVNGKLRSILSASEVTRQSTGLIYQVQAR